MIRKKGRYQLITNFLLSTAEDWTLPKSGRFAVADRMLTEMEKPTIETLRSILRETRKTSGRYPTVFSSIIDLSELRLHLYYKGDFDKLVVLDMRKELERGKGVRRLTSSFTFLVPRSTDHGMALTAWSSSSSPAMPETKTLDRMTSSAISHVFRIKRRWRAPRHRSALRSP